jgi:hypothetical protein
MIALDIGGVKTTIKQGKAAGFVFEVKLGNFWDYTIRFKKPETS